MRLRLPTMPRFIQILGVSLLVLGATATFTITRSFGSLAEAERRTQTLINTNVRMLAIAGNLEFQTQESRRTFLYLWTTKDSRQLNGILEQVRSADLEVSLLQGRAHTLAKTGPTTRTLTEFDSSWDNYTNARDTIALLALGKRFPEALRLERTQGKQLFEHALVSLTLLKAELEREAQNQGLLIEAALRQATLTVGSSLAISFVTILLLARLDARRRQVAKELERARSEAITREGLLTLAQEASHVGTWEWNAETGVANWSAEQIRLFGLPESKTRPTVSEWLELIHPDDREAVWTALRSHRNGASNFECEYRVMPDFVTTRWLYARGKALRDSGGKTVRLIGSTFDITHRKQHEELLARAKDAAEAANNTKTAFLTNMSHELRTPLHGIVGMSQLLRSTELSEEQNEAVDTIELSGKLLLDTINNILDLSRLDGGRMPFNAHAFELQALLQSTIVAAKHFGKG